MADQPSNSPSVSSLIGGIIDDFQRLLRHEVALARQEVTEEWTKTKLAMGLMGAGLVALSIALLMFSFMLVHLIALALPVEWACFGIVCAIFLAIGGGIMGVGYSYFQKVHMIPPRTAQTISDDIQAVTGPSVKPTGSLAPR
jgi:uncharacterized membrane protein YqjE